MSKDFNQAIVMGNLTRDPELRYTPNGQAVTSFSVATNRTWVDANGDKKEDVEYHEVVVWGKLAEIVSQYLGKGRKVLVVGRLQTRNWEGQDGTKKSKTEIVATDINFIDRPKDGAAPSGSSEREPAAPEGGKKEPASTDASLDESKRASQGGETKKEESEEINIEDIPF